MYHDILQTRRAKNMFFIFVGKLFFFSMRENQLHKQGRGSKCGSLPAHEGDLTAYHFPALASPSTSMTLNNVHKSSQHFRSDICKTLILYTYSLTPILSNHCQETTIDINKVVEISICRLLYSEQFQNILQFVHCIKTLYEVRPHPPRSQIII